MKNPFIKDKKNAAKTKTTKIGIENTTYLEWFDQHA